MPSFIRNSIEVVSSASICDDAPEALAEHLVDRPAEIDHPVDGVDAHRRQRRRTASRLVRAPRVGLAATARSGTSSSLRRAGSCRARPSGCARAAWSSPDGSAGCSRGRASPPGLRRRRRPPPRPPSWCSVNGFSQKTCLPAPAAAITCCVCSECGVASTTASTSRIGEQLLVGRAASAKPCAAANCLRPPATWSRVDTAATNWIASLVPLHRLDQRLAPPAQADDGCADHCDA